MATICCLCYLLCVMRSTPLLVLIILCPGGFSSFVPSVPILDCTEVRTSRIKGAAVSLLEDYDSLWKQYQYNSRSPLKQAFEKAGGILYRTSVFSKEECTKIEKDLHQVTSCLKDELTSSVATNRMGAAVCPNSATIQIFQSGSLTTLVQSIMGHDYRLSTRVPVELRTYEKVGAGMQWHVDDVLYDPPQLEVVWTMENNSDCQTMWRDAASMMQTVETDANSVILLTAGGVPHCVSSLKHGRRVIVKCVYHKEGANFHEKEWAPKFPSTTLVKKR